MSEGERDPSTRTRSAADRHGEAAEAVRPTQAERWGDGRAMIAATLGRCPNCREGRAFRGTYTLAGRCPVCGVRFERDPGSWLGAAVIAYALAVLAVAVVGLLLYARHGLFVGIEWWLVATALVTVVVVYRGVKGWWLWVMWAAGWVHRDGEDPERRR